MQLQMRAMLVVSLGLLTGACATAPAHRDSGPTPPRPELAKLPDPVPKVEPKSRYGNPPSYVVFGKTYYVMRNPTGYQETGMASWYGSKFHGRSTSSGERYDMYKLTAAHRSLPIPTYVRVTNLDNQKSAIVRVNDRGPFHGGRLIDLSYAAAVKLAFVNRGTARVRVEALTGSPEPQILVANSAAVATADAAPAVSDQIYLQAGAFGSRSSAEYVRSALLALVGGDVHVRHRGGSDLYRVRVGPIADMVEASRLQTLIVNANHGLPLIVRE